MSLHMMNVSAGTMSSPVICIDLDDPPSSQDTASQWSRRASTLATKQELRLWTYTWLWIQATYNVHCCDCTVEKKSKSLPY